MVITFLDEFNCNLSVDSRSLQSYWLSGIFCNSQQQLEHFSREAAEPAKCFLCSFLCDLATLREGDLCSAYH